MSKRTSSGTSKAKAFTEDGPEGRHPNHPRYQPVARPPNHFVSRLTCRLVSIPKGIGAGRGGSSSASGNGERFVDDQRDISEYINKGNRHVVRPRGIHGGRVRRSNGSGNGDPFVNDLVDIGQDIDEGNKDVVRWRDIHRGRCGSSIAIGEGDRIADDYAEDFEEGIDELYMEYPYRGTCSPTNNFYLQVSSLEVYQHFHTKKGSVSEYITTRNYVYTNNSYAHQSSVASSEVVVNLKQQLEDQEKASHELERVAKERQDAPEEWEREAEQRVKVSPVDINPINSSAYEEGGTTVVGCENDASIQKSNGLATLEKEMETRDCYKVSIDTSLVDAACIPDVGNNGFKIVKDEVGVFFAWQKDQVVFDPKATPPSTIQMNVENKTAPKLHTKRKNFYVSSDAMQRQAKKKSL
ncbi:hypothetical protein Tco_0004077 [Tanacetum coccineum]